MVGKTAVFLILFCCEAVFLSEPKAENNVQEVIDAISNLQFTQQSIKDKCTRIRENFEISDRIKSKKDYGLMGEYRDCQVLFSQFVTDPDEVKLITKSNLSKLMKNDIEMILTEVIHYGQATEDILNGQPLAYYEKSLSEVKFDPTPYVFWLSNARRTGWLIEAMETGEISKDNRKLLGECIAEFKKLMQLPLDAIERDKAENGEKPDRESVVKLLGEVMAKYESETAKLKDDEDQDWSDFEPLFRFVVENRASGFKQIREKFAEIYQKLDGDQQNSPNYDTIYIMQEICHFFRNPKIDHELQEIAPQVRREIFDQVIAAWNTAITKTDGFSGKNSHQRFAMEYAFYHFFNYLIIDHKDQEMFDWFLDEFYRKADELKSEMKSLAPVADSRFIPHFSGLMKSIASYTSNILHNGSQSKFKTYCFLQCFFASTVTLSDFKKTIQIDHLMEYIYVYPHLQDLNPKSLEISGIFANFLASSKLLPLKTEVLHAFLYWSSKFIWRYLKRNYKIASAFSDLDPYLENSTIITNKDPINSYLLFLRLIILAEDPSETYCPRFNQIKDAQYSMMKSLLESPEYSNLTKCLMPSGKDVAINAQIDDPNSTGKLNISVNLANANLTGSKLTLQIDFLENDQYKVTPTLSSHSASGEDFLKTLKDPKGLCKPVDFKLENCLGSASIRLI